MNRPAPLGSSAYIGVRPVHPELTHLGMRLSLSKVIKISVHTVVIATSREELPCQREKKPAIVSVIR